MFSRIWLDVRLAVRAFSKAPTFAAVAVLTVALGVGATTAIFSVVEAVILRPLPFPEPQHLVSVFESFPAKGWVDYSLSHANFWDLRDLNHSLAAVGAYTGGAATLTGSGTPERVSVGVVSAGFFEALAVRPVAGETPPPPLPRDSLRLSESSREASDVTSPGAGPGAPEGPARPVDVAARPSPALHD